MMLGAVLNIILDPVFIFLLDLGVKGAAIAPCSASWQAVCLCFVFCSVRFRRCASLRRIQPADHAAYPAHRPDPFVIIAVDNMMIIALNAVLQRYGGPEQGDLLVAAATVAQSFMLVVTMPLDGIAAGTASILGYNLGAGQPKRILEAQKYTLLLSLAYTTTLCLMGLLLAAPSPIFLHRILRFLPWP